MMSVQRSKTKVTQYKEYFMKVNVELEIQTVRHTQKG